MKSMERGRERERACEQASARESTHVSVCVCLSGGRGETGLTRASNMLGKYFTTKLHPTQVFVCWRQLPRLALKLLSSCLTLELLGFQAFTTIPDIKLHSISQERFAICNLGIVISIFSFLLEGLAKEDSQLYPITKVLLRNKTVLGKYQENSFLCIRPMYLKSGL